jgi:hypothetical protein
MRRYIRHPSDIPIEFEPLMSSVGPSSELLSNVSLGGLSFFTHQAVELGALVRVRIDSVSPCFETHAQVRWCASLADDQYEVGVELLTQDEAFKTRMVEQVCHIEHYRREVKLAEGRDISSEEAAREWIGKYAAAFPRIDQPEPMN